MINEVYVYVYLPHDKDYVVCGKFAHEQGVGKFIYGKSYLARDNAFPLDPINLPLKPGVFTTQANHGYFGVLQDSGPDNWGRKVLLSQRAVEKDELKMWLYGSGLGAGCIGFSQSAGACKPKRESIPESALDMIDHQTIENILVNPAPPEIKHLFIHGSFNGGARPKISYESVEKDAEYIAKFNMKSDMLDSVSRIECATLSLASTAGMNVCNANVKSFEGLGDVACIERFDRYGFGKPKHYISAHSIFNIRSMRFDNDSMRKVYSYPRLASIIRKISNSPNQDLIELYRRMCFSMMVGNSDDHAKNHGFLYNEKTRDYQLAPLFDVVPQLPHEPIQAMALGVYGRESSVRNALSCHEDFGLSLEQAKNVIVELGDRVSEWKSHYKKYGVSNSDIARLESAILPHEMIDEIEILKQECGRHQTPGTDLSP